MFYAYDEASSGPSAHDEFPLSEVENRCTRVTGPVAWTVTARRPQPRLGRDHRIDDHAAEDAVEGVARWPTGLRDALVDMLTAASICVALALVVLAVVVVGPRGPSRRAVGQSGRTIEWRRKRCPMRQ